MSTSVRSLRRCCHHSALLLLPGRRWSSSSVSPPPLHRRLLLFLAQRYYDVEMLLNWQLQRKRTKIQKKNAYYAYTEHFYGRKIAAAYYVLNMRGGFRFVGQTEWFSSDQRGKFSWDFLNHKDALLEEVNLNYTLINHRGLSNLEGQTCVKTLSLRGCPEVNDWFLAGLHIFRDSLEELDISHCPLITIGGLPALRNLKRLRRLDVSSLPRVANPGLVFILLEEMLPQCHITVAGYDLSLRQGRVNQGPQESERQKGNLRKWRTSG
uniref:Distal membrane-arm assembly complex protein 2 n=1 Tax=Takifugu rubripes TaxID=31033 RepID=H2SKP6_TAKRU